MGQLREKRIVQDRIWLKPNLEPIPPYDYDYAYPITLYEAVKKDSSDISSNLNDELESIYRLIADKQNKFEGGTPGNVMTWSGIEGQVGQLPVARVIAGPADRSHQKLLSERAIGDALDTKASIVALNTHADSLDIHMTDIERTRWNGMAPLTLLHSHTNNTSMHVTSVERSRWNSKASQENLDSHISDINNPHNTTAHQVGSYTRAEIDTKFANMRDSFFNYLNIKWSESTNAARLEKYNPVNWNPNFILKFDDTLPDVSEPALTYFALKPVTNYIVNETNNVSIWIKRPGLIWQEIGLAEMNAGDMVIKYPDTAMYVWIQGRFLRLFTGGSSDPVAGTSNEYWRPTVSTGGVLSWERSSSDTPPAAINIKGADGVTPVKGIDYFDGVDGQGVPVGGITSDILIKLTNANYDTTWKSLWDILVDLVTEGRGLPPNVVIWDNIRDRPESYSTLGTNTDGFMTQKAVTTALDAINQEIIDLSALSTAINGVRSDLLSHMNDYSNPHRVTPAIIGATSIAAFSDHVQNFNNPHAVTKMQVGLGNVDNTKDINKPISIDTQNALDAITTRLNQLGIPVINITWNSSTSKLDVKYSDNSITSVSLPINSIESVSFDNATMELVFTFTNGTETRVHISSLMTYTGSTGTHINVIIENDNKIKADIIPSTISELEIIPSVHLRESPTTTTQSVSDNSTRIATTEYVKTQVINNLISYDERRPLSANMGRLLNQRKADIDDVIRLIGDLIDIDVIDDLTSTDREAALSANMGRELDLTKAPRVHTSPSGSTFGIATAALFGHVRSANVDPLMDGTVFRGTDNGRYAREDHRHPSDDTKMDIDGLNSMPESYGGGAANNTISGFVGYTTELNTVPDSMGRVDHVLFNIPFKYLKRSIPSVVISGQFKALMPNAQYINLTNPVQVSNTLAHVTVIFTMTSTYPSNSPCSLVFGDNTSSISITAE